MASRRVQIVLALEIPSPRRPTDGAAGNSRLIREMSLANPLWGAPESMASSQAWYRDRPDQRGQIYGAEKGPPSQGWKAFLRNHADGIVAMDLFVVPTISFRLLYGLLIMGHGRRQILWFGVTAHPIWAGCITNIFGFDLRQAQVQNFRQVTNPQEVVSHIRNAN